MSDSAALTAASIAAGVFAYAFVALGIRGLGVEQFAPTAQLWTLWTVGVAALTLPIQQHMIVHRLGVQSLWPGPLSTWLGWASVGGCALALVGYGRWYPSSSVVFPFAFALLLPACVVLGVSRGQLGAGSRSVALAVSFGSENVLRVACLLALLAVGAGPWLGGAAILFGFVVAAPPLLAARSCAPIPQRDVALPRGLWWSSLALTISQLLPALPVVALPFVGGTSGEVSSMFAATAVLRAPLLVATALAPILVRLGVPAAITGWSYVQRTVLALVSLLCAVSFGAVVAVVARPVIAMIFGDGVTLEIVELTFVSGAMILAVGSFVVSQMLSCDWSARALGLMFTGGAVAGFGALGVLGGLEPVARVSIAFLLAEAVVWLGLVISRSRGTS